jgi:hypothetical protein
MRNARGLASGAVSTVVLVASSFTLSVIADPSPPTVEAATPISLAVVALWEMNETGGSAMRDSGPYPIHGDVGSAVQMNTVVDGATAYRFPRVPAPLDEPHNPERLATAPHDARLNPDTSDYAIEFRYRTIRSFGNVVQKGQSTDAGGFWKFEQANGRMACLFRWPDPANPSNREQRGVRAPAERATNDGQWHTIRCELRRDFGVILFIDGVEADRIAWGGGQPLPRIANDKVVSIGGKSSCNQQTVSCDYFDGDIDYVRIEKGPPASEQAPTAASTRFVPLTPTRIFDTRPDEAAPGPKGVVSGDASIDVTVTGVGGVPDNAEAVAINLTAVGLEPGFVTAWPKGTTRPLASNINLTQPGQVRANLVLVPVGADGQISLYTLGSAHLLGDIAGYFLHQTTSTRAGRIIAQPPQRLFDTRPSADPGPKDTVTADTTIDVDVLGRAGVPDTGVNAVVINLTATAAHGPGFVTAWSGATARPTASSVNINATGETVPNQIIVPINPNGMIRLYSSTTTELLADVTGYVTDATASPAMTGLFVPLQPARLFDTRPDQPGPGPKGTVSAGTTITVGVGGVAGVAPDAGGVIANIAMIGTAPSYTTGWPTGTQRPITSIVNVDGPDARANSTILALGTHGQLNLYASRNAHLLADTTGYLLP